MVSKLPKTIGLLESLIKKKIKSDINKGCKCDGNCHKCKKLVEGAIVAIGKISGYRPMAQEPSEILNKRDFLRPTLTNLVHNMRNMNSMRMLGYVMPREAGSSEDNDGDSCGEE